MAHGPSPQSKSQLKNKLSIIVYEGETPPRYFELTKKKLRFLITALPLITVTSLTIVLIGVVYYDQIKESVQQQHPVIIDQLQEQLNTVQSRNDDLENFNRDLQERLASGDDVQMAGVETISLFRPVAGMQVLTDRPLLTIDNEEVRRRGEEVQFSFHITNQTPENERLRGYLFVLMKSNNSIHIYPKDGMAQQSFQLGFTSGEPFATQRFRPVENITFPLPQDQRRALFKIIIFSRSGDILHRQLMAMDVGPVS